MGVVQLNNHVASLLYIDFVDEFFGQHEPRFYWAFHVHRQVSTSVNFFGRLFERHHYDKCIPGSVNTSRKLPSIRFA